MRLIEMTCPKCGAQLQIDADKKQAFCGHCGTEILIDDEVQHIQYDNAEEAGYNFEKGRQRAQAEARQNQQVNSYRPPVQPTRVPQQPVKKRKTWLWVLGWIFIFPLPLTILLVRKKNMNIVLKILILGFAWLFYLIIVLAANSDSSNTSSTSTTTSNTSQQVEQVEDTKTEPAQETNNTVEQAVEPSVETEEQTVPEVETDVKAPLDNFFTAYIDRGRVDNIKDLADEFGVYTDKKNTGTGRYYYKVALTKDDAKVISLSDLTTGDYCIVIDNGGESLTYYNNVDLVEIDYSDANGFYILDKCRLTPYDDGSFRLKVDNAEAALAYKANVETEISPIEQFYSEAQIGMSKDDFKELLNKYGLIMKYRRSNSDDGYISYSGEVENSDYGTCIRFVMRDTLTDLDFYDYYVNAKYGVHLEYIMDSQASQRSGDYAEPGYYIVGDNISEHYDNAEEAMNALHSYRLK